MKHGQYCQFASSEMMAAALRRGDGRSYLGDPVIVFHLCRH